VLGECVENWMCIVNFMNGDLLVAGTVGGVARDDLPGPWPRQESATLSMCSGYHACSQTVMHVENTVHLELTSHGRSAPEKAAQGVTLGQC
jgi:hypothetical protein